jgi:Lon protease-like protein
MDTIPLFPLSTVLLPAGRLPLQIFEPRYLNLVTRCLKEDSGFGVVLLTAGSEVDIPDLSINSRFAPLGCYAKIVDWNQLPNGLLGITVEGQQKFRLLSSWSQQDQLNMAEVEWLESDPMVAMPESAGELKQLLRTLMKHPHVAQLHLDPEVKDVASLSYILTQLLPIEESIKFSLLSEVDPLQRLDSLVLLLDEMGQ